MEAESVARCLFYFAVIYAFYSLSVLALPIGTKGQQEVAELSSRAKQNSLLKPFRPIVWLLLVPFNSVFAALTVSVFAVVCAWLVLL